MKRLNKFFPAILLMLLISAVIAPISLVNAFNYVETPTIISIQQNSENDTLMITGTCFENTEVMIYIDGTFVGEANISPSDTIINQFNYIIPSELEEGSHFAKALAKDKTSLVLSTFSNELEFFVHSLPAPTMIEPTETTITGNVKPYIKGLLPSGTFARIYIDGIYNGKTEILEHRSGTANFAYKPFLNLEPGYHTAWAVTETENGKKSKISNVLNFKIENPYPAPVLFNPVVSQNQQFIVGLAKNDSKIKVFIDQRLYGEFLVKNHESGTANFAYIAPSNISNGAHIIFTTATDSRGKESVWSNIVKINTISAPTPRITDQAVSEEVAVAPVITPNTTTNEVQSNEQKENTQEQNIKTEEKSDISELIEDKINEDQQIKINEKEAETGLIDENKDQQSKLRWNLIIFIVFLVSVIAWIFWVNRELIKEKKEQEDKETEPKKFEETNKDTKTNIPNKLK